MIAICSTGNSIRFKAHWRDRTIEDAFLTFSLNPTQHRQARMAAVSPLADFSFDYQDLLFKPQPKNRRPRIDHPRLHRIAHG